MFVFFYEMISQLQSQKRLRKTYPQVPETGGGRPAGPQGRGPGCTEQSTGAKGKGRPCPILGFLQERQAGRTA